MTLENNTLTAGCSYTLSKTWGELVKKAKGKALSPADYQVRANRAFLTVFARMCEDRLQI